jgi:hypothetical protein
MPHALAAVTGTGRQKKCSWCKKYFGEKYSLTSKNGSHPSILF